jgi:hypothetical protein
VGVQCPLFVSSFEFRSSIDFFEVSYFEFQTSLSERTSMFSVPNGKPGVQTTYSAIPREVFLANRQFAQFVASPVTIDGTLSSNPSNAPFTWLLFAGTAMGRVTATGKYANSIIGSITAAYGHSGGTSTMLSTDVNTAAEIVRRLGASGSLKLSGPATAGGTMATQVITYSAVNLTTGAITISAGTSDAVSGAYIQPTDGSEVIVTLICDPYGIKVVDQLNTTRVDVFDPRLLAAGGTLNTASILNYPIDTSMKAWFKAAIKAACPAVNFSDDFA